MANNFFRHISDLFTARYPGYDIFIIYERPFLSTRGRRLFMERIEQYYRSVYILPSDIIWSLIINQNRTGDSAPVYILYYEYRRLKIVHIHLLHHIPTCLNKILRCCDRD